ncbi:MAG: cation:proton antiporter [Candidatus Roizmanbacteria bacterium]
MIQSISSQVFINLLLYLLIPFLFGLLAKKLKVSPIIGYLIGGIILGSFFSRLLSLEMINSIATIGIALLMFTTGLELKLDRIMMMKQFIFFGGIIQIVLTAFVAMICSMFFGFSLLASFLIGIAFSSSSTTLVAKIIQERGEESSFIGELAVGFLMFQDLFFIPVLILFAYLNGVAVSPILVVKDVIFGLIEAGIVLWVLFYIGKRFVPVMFDRMAKNSRELLNIFIIIFVLTVAFIASNFGISLFTSAFIAGVLVSQTSEHYHIFSQIRPIRDLLAIVFFVFIGTHIYLMDLIVSLPKILLYSLIIMIAKGIIILIIFLYMKFSSRIAFGMAFFLFQISENAYILMSIAHNNKIISKEQYLIVNATVLMGLIVTPILIHYKEVIYSHLRAFIQKHIPAINLLIKNRLDFDRLPNETINMKDHIVICGYGRVGMYIGRALQLAGIPFIAIDYNYHTVARAKRSGINIIFGDPMDIDILDYAQVDKAHAIVSVVRERFAQETIVMTAKKLNPDIIVISRIHTQMQQQRMQDLGVQIVVQPELEASYSIIKKLFYIAGLSKEDMLIKLRNFQQEQGSVYY